MKKIIYTAAITCFAVGLLACSKQESQEPVTEPIPSVVEESPAEEEPQDMPPRERGSHNGLSWETPDGWTGYPGRPAQLYVFNLPEPYGGGSMNGGQRLRPREHEDDGSIEDAFADYLENGSTLAFSTEPASVHLTSYPKLDIDGGEVALAVIVGSPVDDWASIVLWVWQDSDQRIGRWSVTLTCPVQDVEEFVAVVREWIMTFEFYDWHHAGRAGDSRPLAGPRRATRQGPRGRA